jgi:uncharacterized protein (DUF1330 family)
MPAYMIFLREGPVRDLEAMARYQQRNRENPAAFGIKPLVVYPEIEAVEGKAPDGIIILEFPTVDDARAWYNSPGYQAAIPDRLKAADYRAMIVEGWSPPAA